MPYRNRPDRRRATALVPFQAASAPVLQVFSLVGTTLTIDFGVPVSYNADADIATVASVVTGNTNEIGNISSITTSGPTKLIFELEFNMQTNGGTFWLYYNQQAIVLEGGRVVDPTPIHVPTP